MTPLIASVAFAAALVRPILKLEPGRPQANGIHNVTLGLWLEFRA